MLQVVATVAPATSPGTRRARAWDRFVTRCCGSDIRQHPLWRPTRAAGVAELVTVADGGEIVGGAVVRHRSIPLVGGVGFVQYGPLIAEPDPWLAREVVDAVDDLARRRRLRALIVQPPRNGDLVAIAMAESGYRQTDIEVAPDATMSIPLSRSDEELLMAFSKRRRAAVRRALRNGVEVRVGEPDEFGRFVDLHRLTADAQGFTVADDLVDQLEALAADGFLAVFFAFVDGEAVSAETVLMWEDRAEDYLCGWDRTCNTRVNELLEYEIMRWLRDEGFTSYEFGGMPRTDAVHLSRHGRLPDDAAEHSKFKVGFGGEPVLFPRPMLRVGIPAGRGIVAGAIELAAKSRWRSRLSGGTRSPG